MKNEKKEKRVTKIQRVLEYLQTHPEGITSMEAIGLFGATRLSAIIFDLKKDGNIISTEIEESYDRYGNISRFARYRLVSVEG